MGILDRLARATRLLRRKRLPPDMAPTDDVAALATWVRFPVEPSAARWRGRGVASSGRIGILYYTVHALVRFDDWAAITRALEQLPVYRDGIGVQHWHDFLPADIMPAVEGKTNTRGTYRDARNFWVYEPWKCSSSAWVCSLGDGPYVLGSWSSESVDF